MKSKQLISLWEKYMQICSKHSILNEVASNDDVALIYGSDQFKLNYQTKKVKVDGEWLELGDIDPKMPTPDWIAVKTKGAEYFTVAGVGSPFELDYHNPDNPLFVDGMVRVIPVAKSE